jgi:crossover junction endodeoxyribonuclease RusA
MVAFFVPGVPVPKGSARAFVNKYTGRAAVMQTNAEKQKPWASLISMKAEAAGLTPSVGACRLSMTFIMPRPKAHFRRNGGLLPRAECEHTKAPDLDKIIRLVLDALSGVAYADDSQVMWIDGAKRYAAPGETVGCSIAVYGEGE